MSNTTIDVTRCTYRVTWSAEDDEFVATVASPWRPPKNTSTSTSTSSAD